MCICLYTKLCFETTCHMTTENFEQANQSRALPGFQPQWFFTIMLFFIAGIKLCFLNTDHCRLMATSVILYIQDI